MLVSGRVFIYFHNPTFCTILFIFFFRNESMYIHLDHENHAEKNTQKRPTTTKKRVGCFTRPKHQTVKAPPASYWPQFSWETSGSNRTRLSGPKVFEDLTPPPKKKGIALSGFSRFRWPAGDDDSWDNPFKSFLGFKLHIRLLATRLLYFFRRFFGFLLVNLF